MQINHTDSVDKPGFDAPRLDAIATVRRRVESNDQYPGVVAVLNPQHRVIRCRDGLQWVLQYRNSARRAEPVAGSDWRGRSYCQTREALIRCCNAHAGTIDPIALAILLRLPARIEARKAEGVS